MNAKIKKELEKNPLHGAQETRALGAGVAKVCDFPN
jgi:hypothetical protein